MAIEDKTFWTNPGVDVGGIARAALENFQKGSVTQGASTITQQLIKTRLLGDEKTVTRKVRDACAQAGCALRQAGSPLAMSTVWPVRFA